MIAKKFRLTTGVIAACVALYSATAGAVCDQVTDARIQKLLDYDTIKYHIPGASVSVMCAKDVSPRDFVSGTTTLKGSIPVSANNMFQIGGETELFVATIVLQLEAEGRLSLKDPVSKYLTFLPEKWSNITIQQLLNHTSGIARYFESKEFVNIFAKSQYNKQFTATELINFVTDKNLMFTPGFGWNYSLTDYVLAGMLIESVTGHQLDYELSSRILQPLSLYNTYYVTGSVSGSVLSNMVHGYSEIGLFKSEPYDITANNLSWLSAGSVVTSSHDLAVFVYSLFNNNIIINNSQRQKLLSLVDRDTGKPLSYYSDKLGSGLGIYGVNASKFYLSFGSTQGYSSFLLWLQNQKILLIVNIDHMNKNELSSNAGSTQILEDVLDELLNSSRGLNNQSAKNNVELMDKIKNFKLSTFK